MFAAYSYNAGISSANFLSDVVAILTGETNVNNLSSGCNKSLSTINTTYSSAGWTIHDANAASNRVVIKAVCADGVTTKYVSLDTQTTGKLSHCGNETWDATTHTGTNFLGASSFQSLSSVSAGFDLTSGTMYIYADQKNIIITYKTTGALMQISAPAVELTRDSAIAAIDKGYPCWGGIPNGAVYIATPRIKNMTASGDATGASNYARIQLASVYQTSYQMSGSGRDKTEATIIGTLPPYAGFIYSVIYFGNMNIDAIFTINSIGSELDEIQISGKTYVRLTTLATMYTIWVLKG